MFSLPSVIAIGLLFGLKHALDVDHVAAVASIASNRRSFLGSLLVGAWWGLGHTAALLAAGVLTILFRVQIRESVAAALELGAAVMLVLLGGDTLRRVLCSQRVHVHVHRHGGRLHIHPHVHPRFDGHGHDEEDAHHGVPDRRRPFLVGVIHGLAGSAALMLLVASAIPSPALGFAYIAAFGIGTIGGMLAMTALVGVPAVWTAQRYHGTNTAVRVAAGLFSIATGIVLTYRLIA